MQQRLMQPWLMQKCRLKEAQPQGFRSQALLPSQSCFIVLLTFTVAPDVIFPQKAPRAFPQIGTYFTSPPLKFGANYANGKAVLAPEPCFLFLRNVIQL